MATQQQTTQQQSQEQLGPAIKQGGLYGVIAYVVGYVLSYGYLFVGANESFTRDGFSNQVEVAGWVFYNAQFVRVEGGDVAATGDLLGTLAESNGLDFPAILLTLLVGCLLLAAGYRVADAIRDPATTTNQGSVFGAFIVTGYLPLVFLGGFVFETSAAGMSIRPDIFGGVLLAGIVFPALVGALGGYLAVQRNQN